MQQSTTAAIRSYRIYLRDGTDLLSRVHDVDLASDEQARELAAQMLDQQNNYPCVEVWDARGSCAQYTGKHKAVTARTITEHLCAFDFPCARLS